MVKFAKLFNKFITSHEKNKSVNKEKISDIDDVLKTKDVPEVFRKFNEAANTLINIINNIQPYTLETIKSKEQLENDYNNLKDRNETFTNIFNEMKTLLDKATDA